MGKREKKRDRSRDRKSKDKRHKKDKKHHRRSSSSSSSSSQSSVDYDAMIMSTSAPVLSRDAMKDDPLPSETAGIAKLPPGASLEAHVAENHMTEQLMKKFFPRTVPEIEREARRLYVSNLSPDATDRQLQDFFDKKLRPLRARQGHVYPLSTPVCVGVEMSIPQEGKKPFCFVELVDEDTATTAIEQLAGVQFVSVNGMTSDLRIGRPSNYPGPPPTGSIPGLAFISGIPLALTDEEAKQLFSDFGAVRQLWVLRDWVTNVSKGKCIVWFREASAVEVLIREANGEDIEGCTLECRHCTGMDKLDVCRFKEIPMAAGLLQFVNVTGPAGDAENDNLPPDSNIDGNTPDGLLKQILNQNANTPLEQIINRYFTKQVQRGRPLLGPTRILVLLNLIEENEIQDNEEDYQNLLADIEKEVEKHGRCEEIVIPRFPPPAPRQEDFRGNSENDPNVLLITAGGGSHEAAGAPPPPRASDFAAAKAQWDSDMQHPVKNGVGKVFVVYMTVEEAMNAQRMLSGKRFNGRTVITTYLQEDLLYPNMGPPTNSSDEVMLALGGHQKVLQIKA